MDRVMAMSNHQAEFREAKPDLLDGKSEESRLQIACYVGESLSMDDLPAAERRAAEAAPLSSTITREVGGANEGPQGKQE